MQCDKYYECRDGIARERLCPDGLVFDPSLRKVNKCDQPFNVDCGDRTELRKFENFVKNHTFLQKTFRIMKMQKHQKERTNSAQERTVSSPIQTQQSVTSSTPASMVNTLKTNVPEDFISMNIPELVSGQKMQTARDALKKRKKPRTDLPARKTSQRTMNLARLSLIHTSHTQRIARNSTSA